MPRFNELHFNEVLLGRIMIAKRTDTTVDSNLNPLRKRPSIQSTKLPDVVFENFWQWKTYLQEHSKVEQFKHSNKTTIQIY